MHNQLKTLILLVLLTVLLVGLGDLIGGPTGLTLALGLALLMNGLAYWFSDRIVLALHGAVPLTEAEAPHVYRIVRDLTRRSGMPMPRLYRVPTEVPNAFATGRDPHHAAVAVTDGILRLLRPEELEGVLAHELSHVANRDTLITTVTAVIAGAIMYLARMAQWAFLFMGGSRDDDRDRGVHPRSVGRRYLGTYCGSAHSALGVPYPGIHGRRAGSPSGGSARRTDLGPPED